MTLFIDAYNNSDISNQFIENIVKIIPNFKLSLSRKLRYEYSGWILII